MCVLTKLGRESSNSSQCSNALLEVAAGLWRRGQADDEPVRGHKRLAVAGSGCDYFRDLAGAAPISLDLLRRFFRGQSPADVAAMTDLMIGGHERDLALSR